MVWITLYCNVDNYVKLLCLLCFGVWISLDIVWITMWIVRVVRTMLDICLCDTDSWIIDSVFVWRTITRCWISRYLVCIHHFLYVFGCDFGMSHYFRGKNMVIFGIEWHFWNFRVYSITGRSRTRKRVKCFCFTE